MSELFVMKTFHGGVCPRCGIPHGVFIDVADGTRASLVGALKIVSSGPVLSLKPR